MSSRAPNAVEQRIHQECLSKKNKIISQKEVDELVADSKARLEALNFLLKTGLLAVLKDGQGNLSYRAAVKKEVEIKKDISGDENLVLQAIEASRNEGIWTRSLKNKTELHQTVINRCLKSLEQKQLIKSVKSVKHPTRKLYMMAHLEPSVEVTGGPWYTDHELDTEFIRMLLAACLRFISDRSFPKTDDTSARPLFPISHSPTYPSASHISSFLKKSRITETDLSIEHVESLLNVLVYDGSIERLPAFGALTWNIGAGDDAESSEDEARSEKKKKKKSKPEKKRKRRKDDSSDDDSDDEEEDERARKKKKKKKKHESSTETESESEEDTKKKKKKKRKRESSDEEDRELSKRKKKQKRRKETDTDTDDGGSSEDASRRDRLKPTPDGSGGAHVYRAIRQEPIQSVLQWAEGPCAGCPQFEFCGDGPVNPRSCEYFSEWS